MGREREKGREGIGKGREGEGEWGSPAHYFRLKSCTACVQVHIVNPSVHVHYDDCQLVSPTTAKTRNICQLVTDTRSWSISEVRVVQSIDHIRYIVRFIYSDGRYALLKISW